MPVDGDLLLLEGIFYCSLPAPGIYKTRCHDLGNGLTSCEFRDEDDQLIREITTPKIANPDHLTTLLLLLAQSRRADAEPSASPG